MSLRRALPRTTIGWVLAAVVLIVGLVAMHSLTGAMASCSPHSETASAAPHSMPMQHSPAAPADASATVAEHSAAVSDGSAAASLHCGVSTHGAGAMCVAVLLGLALALLIRRVSRIARDIVASAVPPSAVRMTAAPSGVALLGRLCVLRL